MDGPTYAQIFRCAREQIDLKEIGITDSKIRWTSGGSLLIEVPGFNKVEKANLLANKLKVVLDGKASISRPVGSGELRLWGLDDSINAEEVACSVANYGDCLTGDIRISPFSRMSDGLNAVWIRCLLSAAVKVSALGRLKIGWSSARIELMQRRPIQCYKC